MPPASDNEITKSMSQTAENIMTSKTHSDSSDTKLSLKHALSGTDEEETHLKTTAHEKGQHMPLSNVEDLNLHITERSIMDAIAKLEHSREKDMNSIVKLVNQNTDDCVKKPNQHELNQKKN